MANWPKYLTTAQAAECCNLKVKMLERMRQNGIGPKYIKVGQRIIRYRQEDLDAWLEGNMCWTKDQRPA